MYLSFGDERVWGPGGSTEESGGVKCFLKSSLMSQLLCCKGASGVTSLSQVREVSGDVGGKISDPESKNRERKSESKKM